MAELTNVLANRTNGYIASMSVSLNPAKDYGYSSTVPQTYDISSLFQPGAGMMTTYLVTILSAGNHTYYNYSTSVYSRSYRTTKHWTNVLSYNSNTATYTIASALNLTAYNSNSTYWAAGTGNAGYLRLAVSGSTVTLNGYDASNSVVDNGTSACYTGIVAYVTVQGFNTPGVTTVADQRPPAPTPHSPIESPANFTTSPPPGPVKVVCTAMNEEYGFGSFRSKIWLKYSKDHLKPYHEKGYHAIFKPLIKIAYHGKNNYFSKVVRATIEELVTRRTSDIWQESRGKTRDIRGRIYRAVFEPMCYVVGKIISHKDKLWR